VVSANKPLRVSATNSEEGRWTDDIQINSVFIEPAFAQSI
jgi:hypothetical protein